MSIITEHISEVGLKTYFVVFDMGKYCDEELSDMLLDSLVDFAFGYHTGILKTYDRRKLKEAAKSIYNIDHYINYKKTYIDAGTCLNDEDDDTHNKYLKRGEFGELILHVLSRDFVKTLPLLSKIYFKDSDGMTVHGFDLVHIGPDPSGDGDSLYLGESKLYHRSKGSAGHLGIKELIKDIKSHFSKDFLNREITLINKKMTSFPSESEYSDLNTKDAYKDFLKKKDIIVKKLEDVQNQKLRLQDFLKSVTIPLLCTYQSSLYNKPYNDKEFIDEYEKEVRELKSYFDEELSKLPQEIGQPDKGNLNIILLLFPIKSKKELLTLLHNKLYAQQSA
ncbi:TPA: DUF1837 domain-containing protein [Pasteurella multocida]|uniref:HamA C-terminal domain-containing protein n=2 Tax=Pasteurella multocida TaxID=747 RepID=UPI0032FE36A6|nr:DUF1837 domain-containing protein [Pasteurella multocida]HDR1907187.1 DUF1837 domain-containing protein [Pasteurella multocida]